MSTNSEYVSCIRWYGEPLPPPILTEEDRRECRMYREQAIAVEKRLEEQRLKKLLEKQQQLETLQEELSHECDVSNDSSDSSSVMEVIDFIRSALGDSHDLEEVKFLISQVGEELKNRRSLGSCDSTCNDVDSISLNQNTDSYSLEVRETESVVNSVIQLEEHQSECKKIEKEPPTSEANISDTVILGKKSDKCGNNTNDTLDLVSNIITDSHLNNGESEYLVADLIKNRITSDEEDETISPIKSDETEIITPPRLIRSNSYTLDSPSPSVLMYLRSLTAGKSDEKSEVSTSVVKNLNNLYWDEEKHNLSTQTFPELEDGNKNIEPVINDNFDNKYNGNHIDFVNGHEELNSPKTSAQSNNEKLLRAAEIIQAAGRGFLVRRLMKTQKVKDLKIIIKEAVLCAWSLYGEKAVSPADIKLHERIIQQVTAACYELHCIFFNWSTADRMALIRTDREKLRNPKPKFRVSRNRRLSESDSVSTNSSRSKSTSSISRMTRSAGSSQLQRPTTLPSNPRSKVMYQQQWSR